MAPLELAAAITATQTHSPSPAVQALCKKCVQLIERSAGGAGSSGSAKAAPLAKGGKFEGLVSDDDKDVADEDDDGVLTMLL